MNPEELAPVWEQVALDLGITRGRLVFIRSSNQNDPLRCAKAVLSILPTVDVNALRQLPKAIQRAKQPAVVAQPAPSAPPALESDLSCDPPPPYSPR